jgi:PAS domain S-box-containing protein
MCQNPKELNPTHQAKTQRPKKRCLKELSMTTKPTYKKLAEQVTALEKSHLLLETLMETIEGEAFIKDSKGKYLYVNKSFCQDFGIDPKTIIGQDDYKVFSSNIAKKLRENDRLIMAGKKPVTIEESGVVKGKKLIYMTNKAPLIDSDGNVQGICGVGFNITYQKKLEQELKNSHTDLEKKVTERTAKLLTMVDKLEQAKLQYRTVADFTYDWESWVNLDGSLQYISPSCERISGYTSQQFQENPSLFREMILPKDLGVWVEHYQDSRKNPGAKEIQFRIRHRDGTVRWIEHVCQPVTDDINTLLGFRASNRDITKRKERETQLEKAYSKIKDLKTQLEADQTYLRDEIKLQHNYENIIGNSDVMQYVFLRLQQIAPINTTVLIQGETGTSKELIARAIHNASSRKDRSLIKVDCASLPSNLIESELFGHEKGAFTNAIEKRLGRFELANGSTIFLDEIGELPMDLQSRLLRVLQDGEFERVAVPQNVLEKDIPMFGH